MEPSSQSPKKSSLIPVLGAEGGIILVLVILIAITFNYFNILPISKVIPILPHQENKNQIIQKKSSSSFNNGGKCQNLPKDLIVKIKPPTASVSAELAALLGIWQGKWDGKVPSTLIVSEITPIFIQTIYIYNGVLTEVSYKTNGNNLSSPPLYWQMSKNNKLSGVRKLDSSSSASFIEMEKCKP